MSQENDITGKLRQRLRGAGATCRRGASPAATHGYSMAEALATVAIILILACIVVMNVVSFQATLRQKALDAKAEIIYTAAQEQMTRIMASGREGVFAAPSQDNVSGGTFSGTADGSVNTDRTTAGVSFIPSVNAIPGDATEDSPVEKWQTCYITSADVKTAGTAANLLFGSGGLDDELLNNHWVVEFDYKSLTVHAVYYSEDFNCTDANDAGYSSGSYFPYYNANLRNHALRLSSEGYLGNGKHVGYHGGGSSSTNISFDLDPSIQVSNTEKLTATIKCSRPLIVEDLAFIVTLEDSFGNSQKAVYCMTSDGGELSAEYPNIPVYVSGLSPTSSAPNAVFKKEGLLYTLELTLDSLEGDGSLRFTKLYGSGFQSTLTGSNAALVEGSDISIKVQVVCKKNPLVETGYAGYSTPVVVNSLFDDDTVVGDDSNAVKAGVAGISYGRHLQNLDDGSGVQGSAANISSAEQHADIDFSSYISEDTDNRGWASTYGKLCFEPISNNKLASYEGKSAAAVAPYSIAHLNVNEGGTPPAGLFSSITTGTSENPVKLNNVVLTGATVKGTGSVGGLVGTTSGYLSISNCQLFLSPSEDIISTTDEKTPWLEGNIVGGLVGTNSGSLQISNSSASTVAHGGTVGSGGVAGGLVGINSNSDSDSLKITASYADSYLTASKTGGLVGSGKATVTSSYSAGYLGGTSTSSTAAGLVNGGGRIEDSYTACTTYGEPKLAHYYCASASGDHDNVRYLSTAINATTANENTKGLEDFTDEDSAVNLRDSLNNGGTTFTLEQQSKTYPYNLMDQGLSSYTWPTINNLHHYGDWPAGFQAGTLVYFEKYQIGTGSSKSYCYGFEGANVSSTLINASKLNGQDVIVVGDGYGVVYGSDVTSPPATEVSVLMPEQGKSRSDWDVIATQTIGSGDKPYEVTASNGSSYKIYPLRAKETGSDPAAASITNTTAVNSSSYYLGVNLGSDTYFFNPHFAKTVHKAGADEAPEAPSAKDYIYLRTGRQLYNLSLYYTRAGEQSYRGVTKGCTFAQQRDIAFTDYDWTGFTGFEETTSQAPIGVDAAQSFNATFDGGRFMITDVSFVTADNDYVGMFGYIDKQAVVKNVVLCTDYTPASSNAGSSSGAQADMARNYYVQRAGAVSANDVVNMGVLAGYNAGTITNCATAGYYLAGADGTVHAYANSTVNIGGMVGTNAGSITNSAADSPKLRLSLFESTTNAAGFVGANTAAGAIKNCYALGAIDVADAKGGRASIAGFAGLNQGVVDGSYCATAIASSGDGTKSYGFAPAGGRVTSCEYLNGGTYSYVSRMYPYNFNTNKNYTSGSPIRYGDLKSQRTGAEVDEVHSFVHSQTQSETGNNAYPYRGVVRDAAGAYVHYGNWQDDVVLGTLGIFYWEHEEHGSNDGYHMTYLGSTEKKENGSWVVDVKGGTSLCTSHDDGGVITEYGYGVYTQSGQEGYTTISWEGINCSSGSSTSLEATKLSTDKYNVAASDALAEQMENTDTSDREYSFFAFTTRTDASDFLYLNGGTGAGAKQNGTLTLSFKNTDNNGTSATEVEYAYTVSPFFANAMSIDNIEIDGSNSAATLPGAVNVEASDGSVTDYRTPVGTVGKNTEGEITKNQYETRSLQQLQYINWRSGSGSTPGVTDELVSDKNYSNYPYLLYDENPTNMRAVSDIDNVVKQAGIKLRDSLRWIQTHDLQQQGGNFTPIAGTNMSSSAISYVSYMYTWFGGYYNGQSYTIKNVSISSSSFNVGLFGTTVGAKLSNIIMYGDGSSSAVIERSTSSIDKEGAYALGGLVGVAYDYNLDNPNTIENCAISGYTIRDASGNKQGLGEANVGGLVGVSNTRLSKCSAVTDIVLASSHTAGAPLWGVFIRVGGLTGACQSTIADCYTGGSCTVDPSMATETFSFDNEKKYEIYIGGVAGSGFTSNYVNFTNSIDVQDGSPKVYNSYTYFEFPTDNFSGKGDSSYNRLLTMFTIVSMADRYRPGAAGAQYKATISNCYYLDSRKTAGVDEIFPAEPGSNRTVLEQNGVRSRTYSQMSSLDGHNFVDELNYNSTAWAKVTTEDNAGVSIDGKFSYPSSEVLEGKNYPFPTVVTQNDLTFGTVSSPVPVHVHYGDWPIDGSYWDKGRDTMDIFSDMSDNGWAYKEFTLHVDRSKFAGAPSTSSISVEDGSYASIVSVTASTVDPDVFKVKIQAKREGTTKICFNREASATFTLQITANWELSAGATDDTTAFDSSSNTLRLSSGVNTTAAVRLFAHDASGAKEYSTAASIKWDDPAPAADVDNTLVLKVTDKNKLTVNRVANGSVVVTVTATYNYHDSLVDSGGQTFTQQLFINVEMPRMVGLSNNLAHKSNIAPAVTFNEVQLGGESHDGVNVSYPDAQTKPSPSYAGNNFFLYTKDGDTYLENAANVKSVAVKEQGSSGDAVLLTPGVCEEDKGFYVELNGAVTADGHFAYLGGTLFYTTSTPPGSPSELLEITVTLQGDYRVTTTIPTGWLEQKNAHTVTLQRGDDTKTTRSFDIVDGTAYLKGYDDAVFAKAGWELDGWYTKLNGTTKVLDAAGKVCDDVSGITENGVFKLSGDVTLYAKWKKAKTVWVPATAIKDGERYVIVNSKTAGQAQVVYQADDVYDNKYGVFLDQKSVEIQQGPIATDSGAYDVYIEDPADGTFVWKAGQFNGGYELANEECGYLLAENNVQVQGSEYWAVLAVKGSSDLEKAYNKDNRITWTLDSDTAYLRCAQAGLAYFMGSTSPSVLACANWNSAQNKNAFLYHKDSYAEYTSTYEPKITLTLMNGSEKVANKDVPVDKPIEGSISSLGFTGTQLPASTNGWELLGWYDNATYSDATKVLEPGGSVVGGKITGKSKYEVKDNTLTLKESLTLYAIWRHTITNAYVEVSSPPTSLSSTKTYLIASGDNKFLAVDRDSGALTAVTLNPESGDYYSGTTLLNTGVIITEGNAAWKVSASDDFTLKNVLKEKYLGANDIDNYFSNSSLSMGDTQKQWNYSSGQISTTVQSRYGWELTRYLAYANGNWVGTSSGGALTFYEQQDVYIITANKSN